jgi:hypothetical protein
MVFWGSPALAGPPNGWVWHFVSVKTTLNKSAGNSTRADAEVRQLRPTGKRIASCVALAEAYELPVNRNHPE